jgi:hypothetical protein
MKKNSLLFALLLSLIAVNSCTTDFEVYTPPKEVRVVYGVLNPDSKVQFIRIARAYQIEGDALVYAAENDLSLKGLTVTLKGDGKTWTASEVDTLPKEPGTFNSVQTVYGFVTDGSGTGKSKLTAGKTYQLEIGTPEDSSYVTAHTTIPAVPVLTGKLSINFGSGTYKCLPRVALDAAFPVSIKLSAHATSYEVRIIFNYERNGQPLQQVWGPTDAFTENEGCNDGSGTICYKIADNAVLNQFASQMPDDGASVYTYYRKDSCVLNPSLSYLYPRSLLFEATAVDSYLTNYIYVNDPGNSTDLNTSRPEYTNLTGNIQTAGVFGSFSLDTALSVFNPCSEYLLGLNGTPKPAGFCE